ncbi:Uncharacterised protein [Bacteroides xylanisolvens]|nr:Uncharacterised protein [Bacteroides xylanisolvens]
MKTDGNNILGPLRMINLPENLLHFSMTNSLLLYSGIYLHQTRQNTNPTK